MIYFKVLETPLGTMLAASFEEQICLLEFKDRTNMDKQLASLKKYYPGEQVEGDTAVLKELERQLSLYFKGELKKFTLPLIYRGTPFQEKLWSELIKVPYGSTRSYEEQAQLLGNKNAVRAVAHGNSLNRIAILIPCHRIIGKNGKLTGYAGGLERKARLLEIEQSEESRT
jgi:O-6-methylguanine DNA methyltransferase